MARVVVLAVLAVLAVAAPAHGASYAPGAGTVLHGVTGSKSVDRWAAQTGHRPAVQGFWTVWGSTVEYAFRAADREGTRPMLHISTATNYGQPQRITPLGIARGHGDAHLLYLNRRIAAYEHVVDVRLMAEMNQANNGYAGFDRNGRSRGRSHAPATFRQAWRRAALILRGGSVAAIDARLRALGLPPVQDAGDELPRPRVALHWIPQTRGTPDIPANMPRAYWPGRAYVDWVGTDFYSKFPNFRALDAFYREFRGRPFAFGEWAMWGRDDPGFVRTLFAWVRRRPRVQMMVFNDGTFSASPFRLTHYPRAARELRRQLRR